MSYIIKKTDPLVNLKLTDKGRELLSVGQLSFKKFSLSDGEMIYTNSEPENLNVLRPVDNQPASYYLIKDDDTSTIVPINSISSYPMIISKDATERGFFSGSTKNEYIFNYMLCGAYAIYDENISGGTSLTVNYVSGTTVDSTTINPSGLTPSIGDLVLIKIAGTGYTSAISYGEVDTQPLPHLWYEIVGISGTTTTELNLIVDRNLPNLNITGSTGTTGYAYFYKGGDMIEEVFDESNPSAYWSAGLLDFTDTCSNAAHDVPVWNMNVIYMEDVVGLDNLNYKNCDEVVSVDYRGLYTYLKYAQDHTDQTKFGVIHYTNNTVSNYYGEGFFEDNLYLHLPTLMYHRRQFGGAGFANAIGYSFVCDSTLKYMDSIRYYDLVDTEVTTTAVGKVFPDLKIIVIEDEDLITAMSLKSNRNWSLPKPLLSDIDAGTCDGTSTAGIISSDQELHVTYALIDDINDITGVHCENYATIGTTKPFADVLFRFPFDPEDQTYSEFPYFKKYSDGVGFTANNIWIILQRTVKGSKPDSNSWYYFNANAYIGTNGCIKLAVPTQNDYELYMESAVVSNVNTTTYKTQYEPIGSVIVSKNGLVLKEASDINHIYNDTGDTLCGDYIQSNDDIYFGVTTGHTTGGTFTYLQVGDVLQFHYLKGSTISATTVRIDFTVPNPIPVSGDIYLSGGIAYTDLPSTPAGDTYVFYQGFVLSAANYSVESGGAYSYRVKYNTTPPSGSRITILYLDTTTGTTISTNIVPASLNDLKVILNDQTFPLLATNAYDVNDLITVPAKNETGMTFGDETFFYGNVETKIKATIYRTLINVIIYPNRFIKSSNPTFNEAIHKTAYTELDIYDNNNNVVAVGKFSQPLQRTLNSDIQIINAVIDF